ncbi:MBL fold metallo-hydrolase [Desulfolithobacter sp.]
MSVRCCVLGSGSRGNCTLVESGDTRLLIDGGFSGRETARRLELIGRSVDSLTAILVTHEHNDHISGVGVLSRRCSLPVWANGPTHRASSSRMKNLFCRREFATGERFTINGLEIHPFAVSHDTVDPVGFVISDGHQTLGYCTDTGRITRLISYHLGHCQGLILEANHDPQMLMDGPYPTPLKQRVRSSQGHLANDDAGAFLRQLCQASLRQVILAHLSETNNEPSLALQTVQNSLDGLEHGLVFTVATQDRPTPLIAI